MRMSKETRKSWQKSVINDVNQMQKRKRMRESFAAYAYAIENATGKAYFEEN